MRCVLSLMSVQPRRSGSTLDVLFYLGLYGQIYAFTVDEKLIININPYI